MGTHTVASLNGPGHTHWKLAVLIGLLLILTLGSVPLTLALLHWSQSAALVIDIAGRQRMLTERHLTEVLLASQGVVSHHADTSVLLLEHVTALIAGGVIRAQLGSIEMIQLPPPSTEEIRRSFLEQQRLLHSLLAQSEVFLRLSPDDQAYGQARDRLLRDNKALLQVANEAVHLLTQHAESSMGRLIYWEALFVFMVVLSGALLTWRLILADQAIRRSQQETIAALRQSDALKSALLSSVSHELRTPLTAIKAMLFNLQDEAPASTELSPPQGGQTPDRLAPHGTANGPDSLAIRREFFRSIHDELDHLNGLVGNLLDMSRIEAGTLTPRREWHLLEELVEGAIRRVGMPLASRALQLKLSPDLPPMFVDGLQIQQVLCNLLDNAVKYSPPDSPIDLAATLIGDQVEVRVTNRGSGIPAEDMSRVFQRFYRCHSSATRSVPGTGLGLAICKAFVEAHGGQIVVESMPGSLTTISFRMPLMMADDSAVPSTPESRLGSKTGVSHESGRAHPGRG